MFADLTGLPPLIIQAGTHEVLLDDAVRLVRQAAIADIEVTLDITPGVPHVFQAYPQSSTKRPPHWTGPGSSCRRGSQAQPRHRIGDERKAMTGFGPTSRKPIAVVGATGLGRATVRALLDAHVPVRALVRRTDSDSARALAELGADLVAADLDDFELCARHSRASTGCSP